MSEPFLGEIKLFSFAFAPRGWAQCNGQLLPINQNQALFSLLGTTYGGNGQTTFALPDLRGRTPVHEGGAPFTLGTKAGSETHTLTMGEMPAHAHALQASGAGRGGSPAPAGRVLGAANNLYAPASAGGATTLHPSTLTSFGSGQPHDNMQPFLTIGFCIALQGIFPSRN